MAEPILAPIAAQGRTALIHLASSSQLSSDRFRARFDRGERHAAHMDALGRQRVVEKVTACAVRRSGEGFDLLLSEHPHAGIKM